MAESPGVSVIIPTLRAGDDLADALKSLASDESAPDHEVVVVFNSPKPADLDISSFHPKSRIVQADTNLGFASACNLGAREAVGSIFTFLNDDMTVQPGWLNALIDSMESSECPAAGGKILTEDGKVTDFDGSSVNLLGWGFQEGHGEKASPEEFSGSRRLPFACGGNFVIKSETFERAGGFDDGYFAYYEDVDLGWRLRLLGHEICYAPEAVTFHKGGVTGELLPSALKWFLQERNSLQTIIKNYSDEILDRILPIAIALVSVRAMILSGIEIEDISRDRGWRDWINTDLKESGAESSGIWQGLLDSVRESLKAGMKSSRKSGLPDGWLPIENRGAAGLYALEWCLSNWDRIMEKRSRVQETRVRTDGEILPMFDDPIRPVLGHPREVAAMVPLEGILSDMMKI